MNRKIVLKTLGVILCIEAAFLCVPLLVSLGYHEQDTLAFVETVLLCFLLGFPLTRLSTQEERLQTRDGNACVALCWLVLSVFGALPYFLSGQVPSFIDAFFETVSGFTTTGASVLSSPESLCHGLLLWRSLTQWMGGMGVLVLLLALLPKIGEGSVNLMRAESPGPITTKLLPKTGSTAKILYCIYIAFTAAETVALRLAGMPWFDSVATSLSTISTGGFSVRDAGILYYGSEWINWIIVVFMLLSAVNFSLYFLMLRRRFREALASEELKVYGALVLSVTLLITLTQVFKAGQGLYRSFADAIFQVASLMSTTGYTTADFALWPAFAQMLLVFVMFTGGCAGSTSGGIKLSRFIVLFKSLRRSIQRILHPREVRAVRLEGQRVEEDTVSSVSAFFFAYLVILFLTAAVCSLDGVSFGTAFSSALTMISNVGPGLEGVGPTQNFGFYSGVSKLCMSAAMLLGRLEIMPLLLLFFPRIWQRRKAAVGEKV